MRLQELMQLRDEVNQQRQAATQAGDRIDSLKKTKARLDAAIAKLTQGLSRTIDPARRLVLARQLSNARTRLNLVDSRLLVAETALATAQTALAEAEARYEGQLAALIPQMTPDVPLVLLPVRIETRFIPNAAGVELRVRVYPDDIQVNGHESELTGEEWTRGRGFHEAATAGDAEKRQAWAELASRFGPHRAAWVARQTDPHRAGGRHDRTNDWTLGERATALPDLWYFIGHAGNDAGEERVFLEHGDLIPDPLPLWFDPRAADLQTAGQGVAWLTDFKEAQKVGMAHSIQLTRQQAERLSRLVVVGAKATVGAAEAGRRFEELLAAHHYTCGLGFVPQGTPTNNTAEARSGFQERDPRFNASFQVEQQPFAFKSGLEVAQDGLLAARALGYATPTQTDPAEDFVFAHVQNSGGQEQLNAACMNRALWPATWGYFLTQMMYPLFNGAPLDGWEDYFTRYVRGRGPLPALRVGNQPYGLLPVTSLDHYTTSQPAPSLPGVFNAEGFIGLLLKLREFWKEGAKKAPSLDRVTGQNGSVDVDLNLIETLGLTPATSQARGRELLGPDYLRNLLWFQTGLKHSQYKDWEDRFWRPLGEALMNQHNNAQSALGLGRGSALSKSIYTPAHFPYEGVLVTAEPLSETRRLQPNYITWLLRANLREIHDTEDPDTLLFRVLRSAILQVYAEAALALSDRPQRDDIPWPYRDYHEPELVDLIDFGLLSEPGNTAKTFTAWRHLEGAQVSGKPFERYIDENLKKDPAQTPAPVNRLRGFRKALTRLSALPTAELNRLFGECLDLSSHRLDAWITSYATYRVQQMRDATPAGLTLGGYGWVEWKEAPTAPAPESAGYVQAPSLAHAATAAVLRSGYLSHNADAGGKLLALDLSSRRVRMASWLLEGMRQGQPLGALLGYRFERMLYERSLTGPNLMRYLDDFRGFAPLVANKLSSGASGAVEAVAAHNVVDGLALLGKRSEWLPGVIGRMTVEEKNGLTGVLADLEDALDSVSDLVVAESVYQSVLGNPSRSGGALASIASGEAPLPELEVARSARSGIGAIHRVLAASNAPADPNDTIVGTWTPRPRGQAEPVLNAWAAHLFGEPRKIVFWSRLLGPDGKPLNPPVVNKHTLDHLNLCPLDLLYGQPLAERAQQSGLEQRLLYYAGRRPADPRVPAGALPELILEDPGVPQTAVGPGETTLLAAMEVARAAREVISSARALGPADLDLPGLAGARAIDAAEIESRRIDARGRLGGAIADLKALFPLDRDAHLPVLSGLAGQTVQDGGANNLLELDLPIDWQRAGRALGVPDPGDLEAIRSALLALASFGLEGAVPVSAVGSASEDGQALFLQARLAAAQAKVRLDESDNPALSTAASIETLFGGGFRALPVFSPTADLKQAIERRAAAGDADPLVIIPWLQQAAQVRPAVARLETMFMYAEAGTPGAMEAVLAGQLPLPGENESDTWAALPQHPFPGGRVSMVIFQPLGLDPGQPLAGLALDEWVEIVPNEEETTAVTFHYDAPGARPPQSILLAVPPQAGQPWSLEAMERTICETLELARLRTVDIHSLPGLGHFLPAVFVASNRGDPDPASNPGHDPSGDTVSTNLIFDKKGRSVWHP